MDIFTDSISHFVWWSSLDWTVLAQTVTDPNILGQMQKAFTHFVQTGQAWALLIGLALGYMIRNLTSYG
ncbi:MULTISPECIES: hypothetical protein [Nostocales]|uniref:Uncharacterized protein n=3 Tax=Nostocales TaxID=1161 RepID=A0A0C1R5P4_9CYAN|nr:hypothetical protein [Tolypothrix bouteillei]KAF3888811.1 hypothetical protein DA73_0400027505 [Tolypothrix bouteillei VB521301]